jgi:diguanylate cyclase (GGDEF)-like protein
MVYEEEETTVNARTRPEASSGEKSPVLVALTGNSAGRSFRLDGSSCVIGRSADADFLLDDEGISRKHARVLIGADGKMKVKDLKSTNGTFVNDKKIDVQELKDGDRIRLGAGTTIRYGLEDDVEGHVRKQLFTSATNDALTGVQNKRAFVEVATRSIAYSRRHKAPLALVMFDIDHFKSVNDNYGHPVGDEVLKTVTARVLETIRLEDTLCRVGGEEFTVLLPGIDLENGLLAADRIRTVISRDPFPTEGGDLDISISAGVAQFDVMTHTGVDQLVSDSDKQLYEAKNHGRNCVRPEPPRRRRVFRDRKTVVNNSDMQKYVEQAKKLRDE